MSYPQHSRRDREERARLTERLVVELASCTDADRHDVEDRLVVCNLPVAHAIANRFRDRGVPTDDLQQVACLALVKAAQRFDPSAGFDFLSYCVPTVRGEIRRYFRDHGWTVRPPRRIQELQRSIAVAEPVLAGRWGRSPVPAELAEHLGVPLGDVAEALGVRGAFSPASLDRPVGPQSTTSLGDLLAASDTAEHQADARVALVPLVRRLKARDQHILTLRFLHGRTQQEIADDIGVTQMQVSRLLTRIYGELRVMLGDPDPDVMAA